MTKEEYLDFGLRYKGCGVLFPLYEKLNRFEKRWFTAIQKDVADLEKENAELKEKSSRQSKNYKCDVGKLLEENAEWKQRNETLKDALEHARKVYGDDLEKSYKEIAELKEHHKSVCETLTNTHRNIREQLTKAKELLKKVIRFTWGEGWSYSLDVKVEVEQFLKEVEDESANRNSKRV